MKLFRLAAGTFIAGCSLMLAGCSEDVSSPEVPVQVQDQEMSPIIDKLTRGEESRTLMLEDVRRFRIDSTTDYEWVEDDLRYWDGFDCSLPGIVHITDGKSWSGYLMINPAKGLNPLYMPWRSYCKVTGCTKQLYIVTDLVYDEENKQLTIDGRTCRVVDDNSSFLTLIYDFEYFIRHGRTVNDVEICEGMELIKYSVNDLSFEDKENTLYFESERELNKYLIDMIRAEFGNEFNLNDYLRPEIVLDEPMVNLDEIEKELLGE